MTDMLSGELLALPPAETVDLPLYAPPDGLEDLADREEDGKRLLLYVGSTAFLDVIHLQTEEEPQEYILARLESSPDKAMDMFWHPSAYADPVVAANLFDKAKPTNEDLDRWYGSEAA